jgi:putative two-component system response regulator
MASGLGFDSSRADASGRTHVLLADDWPGNVHLMAEVLRADGHRVTAVADGAMALRHAVADRPDLVLLDVDMPGIDGVEACRVLKTDPRTRLTPVLLMASLQAREDRIRGLAAGCDGFFTKPLDLERLVLRVRSALRGGALTDDLESAESMLVSLAMAIDAEDPSTRGHSERVAELAFQLGTHAGLPDEVCINLRRAGRLHDIGKLGVPREYLHKQAPLNAKEYAVVKQHAVIGYEICRPLRTLAPLLPLIRGHHERLDGRGYPDGLTGDAISLPLRCLTIAHVYDSLTSERPHRGALATDRAFGILRQEAGMGMWDPILVDVLAEMVQKVN